MAKRKTRTWYIKQHSDSRGDSWFNKLKMPFPVDEHMLIIAAVMVRSAYFSKKSSEVEYEEFLKWRKAHPEFSYPKTEKEWSNWLDASPDVPYPDFLGEIVLEGSQVKVTPTGAALCGEEWNCGVATTQKEANELYDLSAPGSEFTDEW